VQDFSDTKYVERDLALIRVRAPANVRREILELVGIFRANVVDVGRQELMIELVGNEEKVGALLPLLEPYGVVEMVRTGRIALSRSAL